MEERRENRSFEEWSPVEMKRWAQKNFHPDAGNAAYTPAENSDTVYQVLNSLTKIRNLREWPGEYNDGNHNIRVTLPGAGDPEVRTIFLPSTPADFYAALYKFVRDGKIDPAEYPLAPLETEDGTRETEVVTQESTEAREVAKLALRARNMKSTAELNRLYTVQSIHKSYPVELLAACKVEDTGESVSLTQEINRRAKELFPRRVRTATTPEKLASFAKDVAEFYFLKVGPLLDNPGTPALVWDEEVRNEMIELVRATYINRIHRARTVADVEAILSSLPSKPVLESSRTYITAEAEARKAILVRR
jgi:hypothetical protein